MNCKRCGFEIFAKFRPYSLQAGKYGSTPLPKSTADPVVAVKDTLFIKSSQGQERNQC